MTSSDSAASPVSIKTFGMSGPSVAEEWIPSPDLQHRPVNPLALRRRAVWINCYNVFDAALPFGGYKPSGWARDGPRGAGGLHRGQGGHRTALTGTAPNPSTLDRPAVARGGRPGPVPPACYLRRALGLVTF